jgi:hypothetical protein
MFGLLRSLSGRRAPIFNGKPARQVTRLADQDPGRVFFEVLNKPGVTSPETWADLPGRVQHELFRSLMVRLCSGCRRRAVRATMLTGLEVDGGGECGGPNMTARRLATTATGPPFGAAVAARCSGCHGEPPVATTCTITRVALADGRILSRLRFAPCGDAGPDARCLGCQVALGGVHHVGCASERCPSCGQRASACGFRL